MTPIRVQRKRTKGWRMPENTVYVGRGSAFGNPFRVSNGKYSNGLDCVSRAAAVDLYRHYVEVMLDPDHFLSSPETAEKTRAKLEPLRGKNLACWCALDEACHADVLIELANGATP